GTAAEVTRQNLDKWTAYCLALKNQLLTELPDYIDHYLINTHPEHSLPNMVSMSVQFIEGESVMLMLDDEDIAVSTRSACATGSLRASHVLISLGLSHADAQGTLVLSFGKDNTAEEITTFLVALKNVVTTLRDISPLYQKVSQG
ncbi:MAG: aminotransferase class V-fold PLP-dependent enzyme, partial [Desulfobacterales bacterium]